MPIKPVKLERISEEPTSAFIAKLMDTAFVIPGTKIRFGLDTVIGLFPGIGDSVGAVISSIMIAHASKLGVPKIVLARMAGNVLINTVVGAIPILGDLFSMFYRSNVKNYALLQRYAGHGKSGSATDWMFVIGMLVVLLFVVALLITGAVLFVKWILSSL